jgi:hypothetical protein
MSGEADDHANLEALKDIEAALIEARQALVRAISGLDPVANRERFIFRIGFARGRLSRVSDRIHEGVERPQ